MCTHCVHILVLKNSKLVRIYCWYSIAIRIGWINLVSKVKVVLALLVSLLLVGVVLYCSFLGTNKNSMLPKLPGGMTNNNNRMNSGRSSASSAKQTYLSKARYVSGTIYFILLIIHGHLSGRSYKLVEYLCCNCRSSPSWWTREVIHCTCQTTFSCWTVWHAQYVFATHSPLQSSFMLCVFTYCLMSMRWSCW